MTTDITSCNRRTFLTFIALGVPLAAASARLWWHERTLVCRACGAAGRPHYFSGSDSLHCPNCGINVRNGRYEMTSAADVIHVRTADPPHGPWMVTQVPFPNPRLVFTTAKPVVTLSELRW